MNIHTHKVEFLCRKCATIQEQLVTCYDGIIDAGDIPCKACGAVDMWMGKISQQEKPESPLPGAVVSPIQLL